MNVLLLWRFVCIETLYLLTGNWHNFSYCYATCGGNCIEVQAHRLIDCYLHYVQWPIYHACKNGCYWICFDHLILLLYRMASIRILSVIFICLIESRTLTVVNCYLSYVRPLFSLFSELGIYLWLFLVKLCSQLLHLGLSSAWYIG